MAKESVTLKEVAQLARVSTSTASRALTGDPRILPETKDRVLAAAKRLRYRPNRIASSLRSKSTGIIGIAINNLDNFTLRTVFERVEALAYRNSLQVLLVTTDGDPDREAQFLDTALELHLDGVIVAGSGRNAERVNTLMDAGCSVVITNRLIPDAKVTTVLPDFESASALATRHLLELGHTKIAFIGGLMDYQSGRENYAGYAQSLRDAGVRVDERLVERGEYERSFGVRAAERVEELYHEQSITGVVLANHEAAHHLLLHLLRHGIGIPKDLSLVCVEDSPLIEFWNPTISAVDVRPVELADRVFNLLMQGRHKSSDQESESRGPKLEKIGPHFIDRGSTRAP